MTTHSWTTPRNNSHHFENPVVSDVSFSIDFLKAFFFKVTWESRFAWWFTFLMMAWEMHSTWFFQSGAKTFHNQDGVSYLKYAQKRLQHCKSWSLRIWKKVEEKQSLMQLCTFFQHAGINMVVAAHFLWTSDVRTVAVHCITLYSSNRLFAY